MDVYGVMGWITSTFCQCPCLCLSPVCAQSPARHGLSWHSHSGPHVCPIALCRTPLVHGSPGHAPSLRAVQKQPAWWLPTGRCPVVPQCLGCRHRTHAALNTLVSKLIPSSVSVQSSLPARLLALVFPKPKLAQPGQAEPAHSKQ